MNCRLCFRKSNGLLEIFGKEGCSLKVDIILKKHFYWWPTTTEQDNPSPRICKTCWCTVYDFDMFYTELEERQTHYRRKGGSNLTIDETIELPSIQLNWDEVMGTNEIIDIKQEIMAETVNCSASHNLNSEDQLLQTEAIHLKMEFGIDIESEVSCKINEATGKLKTPRKYEKTKDWIKNRQHFLKQSFTMSCTLCDKVVFENWDEMTTHYQHIHNTAGFLVCMCCSAKYTDQEMALSHAVAKVDSKAPEKSKKRQRKTNRVFVDQQLGAEYEKRILQYCKFECDTCTDKPQFKDWRTMKAHYAVVHQTVGYVTCSCCNEKYVRRLEMFDHVMLKFEPDRFKCSYCGVVCKTSAAYGKHMSIHEPEKYARNLRCPHCPTKTFKREPEYKEHLTIHLPEEDKKLACNECGKKYHTERQLKFHISRTHNKLLHICEECGKSFYTISQLKKHTAKHHSGVQSRKVQCDVCKKWIVKDYMVCHFRTTHRNNTLEHRTCKICGKVSASANANLRHVRITHKSQTHKCEFCSRSFAEKIAYQEHLAVHTGASLYNCFFCPLSCRSNANMYKHLNQMHKEAWQEKKKQRNGAVKLANS